MPKKISVDEIIARRKDIDSDKAPIIKAAKAPASWNKNTRSARFVMNAQSYDRYGDQVMTAGIDTTQFEANPVALLFHNSRSWPVGSWDNLEKVLKGRPPRIEGDMILLPAGGPVKEIDETEWMIANGGIRACSIGFIPDWDQAEMILDDEGHWQGGVRFNASEMIEASIVAIPASPESLIKTAGRDMNLARELLEDVLDNWVRSPEGLLLSRADFEAAYRTTVEKIKEDEIAPVVAPDLTADELRNKMQRAQSHTFSVDQKTLSLEFDGGLEEISFKEWTKELNDVVLEFDNADPKKKGMDLLTDEVLDAFAAQIREADVVVLRDADEVKLVIEREGEAIGELVLPLDLTIRQIDEVSQSICDRVNKAKEPPVAPKPESITIELDTTEATEKLTTLQRLAESVGATMARIFGTKEVEKEEPDEDPEDPPEMPCEEEVEAAKAATAAILARMAAKGLIEA